MSDPSQIDPLMDGGKVASGGILAFLISLVLKNRNEDRVIAELREFRIEVRSELEKLSDRFELRYAELEKRVRANEEELAENRRRSRDSGIQKAP